MTEHHSKRDGEDHIIHLGLCGAGGYGEVHKMKNLHTNQVFARKLIRPFVGKCDENDIANEARAIDKLCLGLHGNIVTVFAHGRISPSSSYYFIDMEFCQINLADYIHGSASISIPSLVDWKDVKASGDLHLSVIGDIMKHVLAGLIFIHEQDEVHRDFDPLNVMYFVEHKLWKIADFGLTSEGTTTRPRNTELGRGKRCYVAPELLRDPDLTYNKKVDIWSLGCILHELCTGQKAFRADMAALEYFWSKEAFKVNVSIHDLPIASERLGELIQLALHADCSKRPPAREMQHILSTILESNVSRSHETSNAIIDSSDLDTYLSRLSISHGINSSEQESNRTSTPAHPNAEIDYHVLPEQPIDLVDGGVGQSVASSSSRQSPKPDESPKPDIASLSEKSSFRFGEHLSAQLGQNSELKTNKKIVTNYEADTIIDTVLKIETIPQEESISSKFSGKWLSPQDADGKAYEEMYLHAFGKLTDGTCQWILNHPDFQSWVALHGREVLWISGGSGCGKTTAMAFLTNYFQRSSEDTRVIHQFCGRSLKIGRDDSILIIRSLIFQLWAQTERDPHCATYWHLAEQASPKAIKDEQYWKQLFCDSVRLLSELNRREVLVLDAVDECQGGEKLLSWLLDVTRQPNIRLMFVVSSRRPNVSIEHLLENSLSIKMDLSNLQFNQVDIFRSTREQLWEGVVFGRLDGFSESFIQEIATTITNEAQGMYIWASLIVGSILEMDVQTEDTIRNQILTYPRKLDEVFVDTLTQLENKSEDVKDRTYDVLLCLLYCYRPLSLTEIYSIVFTPVRPKDSPILVSEDEMSRTLQRSCSHLITISSPSVKIGGSRRSGSQIRFRHSSVIDFLLTYKCDTPMESCTDKLCQRLLRLRNRPASHERLASLCLKSLHFLWESPGLHDAIMNNAIGLETSDGNLFFLYASLYWVQHVHEYCATSQFQVTRGSGLLRQTELFILSEAGTLWVSDVIDFMVIPSWNLFVESHHGWIQVVSQLKELELYHWRWPNVSRRNRYSQYLLTIDFALLRRIGAVAFRLWITNTEGLFASRLSYCFTTAWNLLSDDPRANGFNIGARFWDGCGPELRALLHPEPSRKTFEEFVLKHMHIVATERAQLYGMAMELEDRTPWEGFSTTAQQNIGLTAATLPHPAYDLAWTVLSNLVRNNAYNKDYQRSLAEICIGFREGSYKSLIELAEEMNCTYFENSGLQVCLVRSHLETNLTDFRLAIQSQKDFDTRYDQGSTIIPLLYKLQEYATRGRFHGVHRSFRDLLLGYMKVDPEPHRLRDLWEIYCCGVIQYDEYRKTCEEATTDREGLRRRVRREYRDRKRSRSRSPRRQIILDRYNRRDSAD